MRLSRYLVITPLGVGCLLSRYLFITPPGVGRLPSSTERGTHTRCLVITPPGVGRLPVRSAAADCPKGEPPYGMAGRRRKPLASLSPDITSYTS